MMKTMRNPLEDPEPSLRDKYDQLLPLLDQRQARLVLAADANDLAQHGYADNSIEIIARAARTNTATIRQGINELKALNTPTN